MKFAKDPDRLGRMIEHVEAAAVRYEAEAAVFAALGEAGKEMAKQRLEQAADARDLWGWLLVQ